MKLFLHDRIENNAIREIIVSLLDRNLVKSLFMPLVYGKTMITMEQDINNKYGSLLSKKDSHNLAKLTHEFWIYKYPDIVNLMKLISVISWFSSAKDRAVVYNIPYYRTKQDYMSFIKEQIVVYERNTKKRKRITLNVPTTKRDRRKTQTSTCANFITTTTYVKLIP